jgi:sulfite exporter TauE/SafE
MAIATSIAIGNPFYSALFMFVFGLSTIPGLFGIGISKSFMHSKIKNKQGYDYLYKQPH